MPAANSRIMVRQNRFNGAKKITDRYVIELARDKQESDLGAGPFEFLFSPAQTCKDCRVPVPWSVARATRGRFGHELVAQPARFSPTICSERRDKDPEVEALCRERDLIVHR